ncbi:MAG: UvrD-helicase domain-containing protein, partial [Butyrivibrio sp.]|nr:UvrD-helicase domain-containing protein [Butyrivibrio sp.]
LNDKSFMDFKRFSAKTYGEYREAFYAAKDCRVYAGKKSTDNMLMKYYERFFDLSDIKKMMMLDGESIEDLESCDLIRNRCGKLQPYTDAIVDIVETLYNRFDEVKREAGVVDFNDMEHYALNILTNEDEDGNLVPSDIAKELGSFYRQIMIDEYQDSNLVQEEILSSIAKGNESGTTHMFMVGDVKQSIYSFRHARPELFMGKFDRFEPEELYVGKKPAGESDAAGEDAIAGESDAATEGLEGASKSSENTEMDSYAAAREGKNIRIVLDRNYRSRIGVLEQVNVIFKMLMRKSLGGTSYGEAESLKYGGLFEKGDQSMINTGKPFDLHDYNTELILVETNNRKDLFSDRNDVDNSWMDKRYSGYELEAMAIGKRILEMKNSGLLIADTDENKNEIKRELRFSDIVILLRSAGKEGNKYRNILTNMGIPVSSEGKTGYFDTVEVQIVMNYLKLIDNPIQDIPFVSVLKSSFVGFSDEDLALIEIHSDAKSFYEKALSFINKKGLKGRQIELQIRLKEFVEGLESYRRAARSLSVYDLLSSLYYGEKGFYDIVKCQKGGEQRAANLDVLLQKALEIGSNGNRSILDFTHYIDNLKKKDVDYGEADVTGENADTVKIMTIHKSKGLEFPVVFLGMTGKKFNDMDTRNKVIMDNDLGMAFTDFSFDERFKSEWVYKKFIAANIKRNMKAEEQRVLYVALTRAKEKLIIVGSMDFSAKTTAKNTDPVDVYDTKFEDYFSTFQKAYNTRLLNAEEDNSYYKWILSALYGNSAFTMARAKYKNMMLKKIAVMQKELEPGEERIYEIPEVSVSLEEIKKGAEIKDCLRVGIVSNEMAVKTYEKIKENLPEEERISSSGINDGDFGDAHEGLTERLDRQLHFVYPFANKNKYPSKVSVSALKAASHEDHGYKTADENEVGILEEQIYSLINDEMEENEAFDSTIPSFMKTEAEKKYVPANELGTTYHKLMEMLPFENMEALKDDESVKVYIKSLSDKKLIPVNHSDYIVDNKKLFDFVCGFVHSSSDVLKGMEDAS